MKFLEIFQKSIYGPEFYRELLDKPFSHSFKYFYSIITVIAFIGTALFSFYLVPAVSSFFDKLERGILNYYPQELVVTVKKGEVSVNVQEPYFIAMPSELKPTRNHPELQSTANNLLVIDTNTSFNVDKFSEYDTVFLLTKNFLVVQKDSGEIRIEPLNRFPDVIITKEFIEYYVRKIVPYTKFLAPILVLMVFIFFFAVLNSNLIYLLFGALIVWLAAKFIKLSAGYKKSYQIGLHAVTLALVLRSLVYFFDIKVGIPFWFTTVFIVSVLVNLIPLRSKIVHDNHGTQANGGVA